MRQFEQYAGRDDAAAEGGDRQLAATAEGAGPGRDAARARPPAAGGMGVRVEVVDVMRTDDRRVSLVSFYAAGIGVMFLLFSSRRRGRQRTAGRGGVRHARAAAVDEHRHDRPARGASGCSSRSSGSLQLTVMFLWGTVAFGLPLFSHLPGFVVMTAATASAAAALGLVLATLARTRAQLSGFSTILILTMSALGGSMFPRFLMSENMQKLGLRDVQRVGARRLPEGVLAPGGGVAALAAGAGARRVDRGVPRRRPYARETVGGGVGAPGVGLRSQVVRSQVSRSVSGSSQVDHKIPRPKT